MELAPLSVRIPELRLVQKYSLDRIDRGCRRSVRTTANVAGVEELIVAMVWRPLACYAFIKIKLASCHLLLYVVYTCQKSFNFIDTFSCYKQKCKLAPFNLAHSVYTFSNF